MLPLRPMLLAPLALVACAPPDPVEVSGAAPEIKLIHPTDQTLLEATPDPKGDCVIDLIVAVDILNFEFISPDEEQSTEDDKGHFHIVAGGNQATWGRSLLEELTVSTPCPTEDFHNLHVEVFLVRADHTQLENPEAVKVQEPEIEMVE